MTRIRMVGLALVAVFAVAAVASASASAFTNPILLNAKGESVKTTFTSASVAGTEPTLNVVGGAKVTCTGETSAGSVETTGTGVPRMTLGTSNVTFKGCQSGSNNCNSTGAAVGEIKNSVSVLLVWVGTEANKTVGVLLSILPLSANPGNGAGAKVTFECGAAAKVEVEGSFCAPVKPGIGVSGATITLQATQSANGVQSTQSCEDNGVVKTKEHLWSKLATETTFKEASEVVEDVQTYKEKVEAVIS